MELIKCTKCQQHLIPTSLGWICDNSDCDESHGLCVMPDPDNVGLNEAIDKPEYRVHDIANELNSMYDEVDRLQDSHRTENKALREDLILLRAQRDLYELLRSSGLYERLRYALAIVLTRCKYE